MSKPYSIKIFLPDGDPDGLRTIEKSHWNGSGIIFPRMLLKEAKKRAELDRAGVYILIGPPEELGLPKIYVGEGDPIKPRLEQHAVKKEFWTSCVAFTSKDGNLNKAHVQYVEARLVSLAAQAKRCLLDNGTAPALPSFGEADRADAEGFLSEILLCLPVLSISVFTESAPIKKTDRTFQISAKGIQARGIESVDGFQVLKSSWAVKVEVSSCPGYLKELRAALIANGVLISSGEGYLFSQDYVFSSPSTAAGVIQGRAANGRVDWKTSEGKTLKKLQED